MAEISIDFLLMKITQCHCGGEERDKMRCTIVKSHSPETMNKNKFAHFYTPYATFHTNNMHTSCSKEVFLHVKKPVKV